MMAQEWMREGRLVGLTVRVDRGYLREQAARDLEVEK